MTENEACFVQCNFCDNVVSQERSVHLFRADDAHSYRLRCGECGTLACEHCAALTFSDTAECKWCMRCNYGKWEAERVFVVQYHFAFTNRVHQQFASTLHHPCFFPSQKEALRVSMTEYFPIAVRSFIDPALASMLAIEMRGAWSSGISMSARVPWFVYKVKSANALECSATVTIHCFPLRDSFTPTDDLIQ